MSVIMKMKVTLWKCSSIRLVPQNVCRGGVACTLNTRYEDGAVSDYINLAHYPKTVVRYVYEKKKQSDDPHSPVGGARMD